MTPVTILLVLHAAGLILLVLRCRVVAALTRCALECDDVTHVGAFRPYLELATGIEPVTSSLPRTCSTN